MTLKDKPRLLSYLFICMSASVGALLLELFSHWAHSEYMPYPDKLFDGGRMSDNVLNELMSPEHRVFGHYDSVGWWEFYSWRNYAIHAGPYLFVVLATAILNWDNRVRSGLYMQQRRRNRPLADVFHDFSFPT